MHLYVENVVNDDIHLKSLDHLFDKFKDIELLLDLGHANMGKKPLHDYYFRKFKDRIGHIHMHDNDGSHDQHLPIGKGTINWKKIVRHLKRINYDNTITFEVFDRRVDSTARENFKKMWE